MTRGRGEGAPRLLFRLIGVSRLYASGQPECLDNDLTLNVGTRHVQILTNVQPYWLDLLARELNEILEAKHVVGIFHWESFDDIAQLNILDVSILLRQDKDVTIRVLHFVIILNEVFTDDGNERACGSL